MPVEQVFLESEGGEAHPDLECDSRLLRQHRDRAVAPGCGDQRAKRCHDLGVASYEVIIKSVAAACV